MVLRLTGLNALSDFLSGFERIKRTPSPPAYSIHLYHVIWLYMLSLPFQLVDSMGWWTIAGIGITAFTFLGILEIGYQIEDPFGYDDNDLVSCVQAFSPHPTQLQLGSQNLTNISYNFPYPALGGPLPCIGNRNQRHSQCNVSNT